MALKVLGQVAPAATTATTLYECAADTSAVVSTVAFCNTGTADIKVRLAHRPEGASLATAQYVLYDTLVAPGTTMSVTWGITMAATDVLTVYTDLATLSVTAWGDET